MSEKGWLPTILAMLAYGFVLEKGSELLAEGSELLLETGLSASIIGGVILPMLGAVPDAAIVLASSLHGATAEDLGVAIGTLAGSTCMLIALSMGLIIIFGACDLRNGVMVEGTRRTRGLSVLTKTGVIFAKDVRQAAVITAACFGTYLVIQIPEWIDQERHEAFCITAACFACLVLVVYFVYMIRDGTQRTRQRIAAERHHALKLAIESLERMADAAAPNTATAAETAAPLGGYQPLDDESDEGNAEMRRMYVDGERATREQFAAVSVADVPDAVLSQFLVRWRLRAEALGNTPERTEAAVASALATKEPAHYGIAAQRAWKEAEDEDEKNSENKTRWAILRDALLRIVVGTVIVSLFSDPVVDAFKDFAEIIHVDSFYIAFFLSPIASNASEFIGSIMFAMKRKPELLSMSAASLLGAATMNSTLVLAVLLTVMSINDLVWNYAAEVYALAFSTLASTCIVAFKKTIRMIDSLFFIGIYIVSFLFVVFLKKYN